MAPMKKTMKAGAKAMTKGAIAEALATSCELKKSVCAKVLDTLAEVATTNVKKAGIFAIPGLCRLKIRTKPSMRPSQASSRTRRSPQGDWHDNGGVDLGAERPLGAESLLGDSLSLPRRTLHSNRCAAGWAPHRTLGRKS